LIPILSVVTAGKSPRVGAFPKYGGRRQELRA